MYVTLKPKTAVKVADEVWIATALLHKENPTRRDFTVNEIVGRARKEALEKELRPGVRVHALQHCVANRPPNPARYRMLYATGKLTRRLYREGDPYDPGREGGKIVPAENEIPDEYHKLLAWYESQYTQMRGNRKVKDSILELKGLGKEIWRGVNPDEYVRKLREGWE